MVATLQGSFGTVALNMPALRIGSAPDNQLVINDPGVSSYHAIIGVETQRVRIIDVGSASGTFVNEQRLDPNSPRFLVTNDTIRIGNTTFRYEERIDDRLPNRESNPGVPPNAQAGPGIYTDYGQQQDYQYPPFPGYTPPPPYGQNPYDQLQAPTQVAGGHAPFSSTDKFRLGGLQGQPQTPPSECRAG